MEKSTFSMAMQLKKQLDTWNFNWPKPWSAVVMWKPFKETDHTFFSARAFPIAELTNLTLFLASSIYLSRKSETMECPPGLCIMHSEPSSRSTTVTSPPPCSSSSAVGSTSWRRNNVCSHWSSTVTHVIYLWHFIINLENVITVYSKASYSPMLYFIH